MKITEQNIVSHDGLSYYSTTWCPDNAPVAVILFLHGHGDHCRRYDEWFEGFIEAEMAVFAIDYRGHGQSEGKRGVIGHFSDLQLDVNLLFAEGEKRFPETPKILYGHSMGATILLHYLLNGENRPKLAIASSPWLVLRNRPGKWMRVLIKTLNNIAPSLTMKTGLRSSDFSSVEGFGEKREKDPWVHNRISARLFTEVQKAAERVLRITKPYPCEILLLQGDADKVTSPEAPIVLANRFNNIKFVNWPGGNHQLHNANDSRILQDLIIDWIKQHL